MIIPKRNIHDCVDTLTCTNELEGEYFPMISEQSMRYSLPSEPKQDRLSTVRRLSLGSGPL